MYTLNHRGYGIKPTEESLAVVRRDLTLIETETEHNRFMKRKKVLLYWLGLSPDLKEKWIYVPRDYGFRTFGYVEYLYPRCEPLSKCVGFEGELRPDQKLIVNTTLEALRDPQRGGGIINKTTGGGKTCIAMNIIATLGVRTIFVVNMIGEIEKTKKSIEKFLPNATIGVIQGPKFETDADIVIAMIQTLASRYDTYAYSHFWKFGLCIFDEVHSTSPGQKYSRILKKMQVKYRLGLTATLREDIFSKVYIHHIGPVIVKDKKVDIVPRVETKKIATSLCIPYTKNGKMNYTKLITDLAKAGDRNRLLAEIIIETTKNRGSKRRVIVFTHRWAHAQELARIIGGLSDLTVGPYVGKMKKKELEYALNCDIMVATYSFASQAFDHPPLDTVIFASPRSVSRKKDFGHFYNDTKVLEQAVGRCLRQVNSNCALVVDIVDILDSGDTYFKTQYYKRRQFYRESGYDMC